MKPKPIVMADRVPVDLPLTDPSWKERAERAEADLEQVMEERDAAQEWADRLAYAIAPEAVIGEHSNLNHPWVNALALAVADSRTERSE